ncbi:MAG TPA: hypothetical protein VMV46_16360 [Thermoanaerobaculia bacterium]|nr:hypothetical protein [Thermoanaerobaculia bacterium]
MRRDDRPPRSRASAAFALAGVVVAAVGAGLAWGAGAGLLVAGVLLFAGEVFG